jgi:spore germination cell wall hydrolase CwlJ-like protein
MACNAYHEAAIEGFRGMVEVNRTVITRAQSGRFPRSLSGVIYQPSQFSWTLNVPRCVSPSVWNEAIRASQEALRQGPNGKIYYHATYVRPYWSINCSGRNQVGTHIFYSDCSAGSRVAKSKVGKRVAKAGRRASRSVR